MGKSNGKSETEKLGLDLEHELPPAGEGESRSEAAVEGTPTLADSSVLAAELQKLKAERDALLDRLARVQAEFDNARKRAAKEQLDFRDFATAESIKALLPVLDSFERALKAQSEPGDFRSGVELIYKQLEDVLAKLGVRAVAAQGEPFDPRYHEAIEMVETSDVPDHLVLEELQRGYKLKERLLRPAMVRVAKNPGK